MRSERLLAVEKHQLHLLRGGGKLSQCARRLQQHGRARSAVVRTDKAGYARLRVNMAGEQSIRHRGKIRILPPAGIEIRHGHLVSRQRIGLRPGHAAARPPRPLQMFLQVIELARIGGGSRGPPPHGRQSLHVPQCSSPPFPRTSALMAWDGSFRAARTLPLSTGRDEEKYREAQKQNFPGIHHLNREASSPKDSIRRINSARLA